MTMKTNPILAEAVEIIKNFGYDCYVVKHNTDRPNDEYRYCYITDGTNISYMQVANFNSGIELSTVHKGNRKWGTGIAIYNPNPISQAFNRIFTLDQITKTIIEGSFGKPNWAKNAVVEKYKSWEDYSKNSLSAKLGSKFFKL